MRPLLCAAIAAALTLGTTDPARSQSSLSGSLTADQAVREALDSNRDLQAARQAIDIAQGGLLQAGRLANPEFELDFADDFAFNAEGERNLAVGFAQQFPVTARLRREKDVARKDVEIAAAEVRDFARRTAAEVQSAFYSVRAVDEQLVVNRELIASVQTVEDATARRVKAAEASPAEVGLLRIERLRLEQDAQRLARDREVAIASLRRLLGRTGSTEVIPVGDLDPGPITLPVLVTGPGGRPDLEAAETAIERAEADQALAKSEIWEDWTLGLGFERERGRFDAPIGTKRDEFLTLGVSIPFPLWDRQQGRNASAAAVLRQSRRQRDALLLRIEEERRAAAARVRTLRSSATAYAEQILPEATRAQELYERGYRQGLVGISELLQAQRQYNESRSFYFELLGDLRQAAIALEAADGSNRQMQDYLNPGGDTQ